MDPKKQERKNSTFTPGSVGAVIKQGNVWHWHKTRKVWRHRHCILTADAFMVRVLICFAALCRLY